MNSIRSARSIGFATACLFSVALGASGQAHADVVTTPGANCKSVSEAPEAIAVIDASISGISNRDPQVSRAVFCPVVRRPVGSDGVTVFVDGVSRTEDAPVSCSASTFNFNGNFIAAKVFTARNRTFDQPLSFSQAEAPLFSYITVQCTLPTFARGQIFGVLTID